MPDPFFSIDISNSQSSLAVAFSSLFILVYEGVGRNSSRPNKLLKVDGHLYFGGYADKKSNVQMGKPFFLRPNNHGLTVLLIRHKQKSSQIKQYNCLAITNWL